VKTNEGTGTPIMSVTKMFTVNAVGLWELCYGELGSFMLNC